MLGWEVRHSIWGFLLIVASSRLGLEGEVLVIRQQHTLLVATLAQRELSIAGAVWAAAAPGHRHIARPLLEPTDRRRGEKEGDG